jgi:hypothetical protein
MAKDFLSPVFFFCGIDLLKRTSCAPATGASPRIIKQAHLPLVSLFFH